MSASNVEVVLGPPGTGKTTTLTQQLQWSFSRTEPENVAFTSFTRAAREEALRRVVASTSYAPESFPWFRTVHGTAYRLLGLKREQVLGDSHWQQFATQYGYTFSKTTAVSVEEGLAPSPRQTPDDVVRATYEWGRSRLLTPAQTMAHLPADVLVLTQPFKSYVERYQAFKKRHGLYDFHDMICACLERGLRPNVTEAFIDEAQDLSPLQIKAVQTWYAPCRKVIIGGDDDQAIYGFQGADPSWLVALSKAHPTTVLQQSYRVPAQVHAFAQRIIGRNQQRVSKTYLPRPVEGSVDTLPFDTALKEIDATRDTFILVRNRCFMQDVAESLRQKAIPYVVEGGGAWNPAGPQVMAAARGAWSVAGGYPVDAGDFRAMLEFIPSNGTDLLPRGIKAKAENLSGRIFPDDVRQLLEGGLLVAVAGREGPYAILKKLQPEARRYLERVEARYGRFLVPKVTITTMHAAKGREKDVVILVPDMTKATYRQSLDQRHGGAEAENRVAYVAATRAKERLVITTPRGKYAYSFPSVPG
jgi:DNA helicase-2/ATP-dependent DNA helicase PcrA